MELKVNVNVKAVASQLLKDMCLNMHNNVVSFTQQKFSPTGWNPVPFPFGGPGMGGPGSFGGQQAGMPYGYTPEFSQERPHHSQQFQPFARPTTYYSPEFFKDYAAMMDKLSTDEELIGKIESIVATHLQEYLNLNPSNLNDSDRPNGQRQF